jgi:BTB/POZ domain
MVLNPQHTGLPPIQHGCLEIIALHDGLPVCQLSRYFSNRSPVLRAMLTACDRKAVAGTPTTAGQQLVLSPMKLQTGLDLLFYLYNRRLREGADLRGLLVAADKYDLRELKLWCARALAAGGGVTLKATLLKYIAAHMEHL